MSRPAPPDWEEDDDEEDTYIWDKADGVTVEILHSGEEPDKYNVRVIDRTAYDKEIHLNKSKSEAHAFAENIMKEISNKHLDILQRRSSDKPKDKDFNPPQENTPYLAVQKVAENY